MVYSPWPGIEPGPPALGAGSLSHWTTREVPILWLLNSSLWLSFPVHSFISIYWVPAMCWVLCYAFWLSCHIQWQTRQLKYLPPWNLHFSVEYLYFLSWISLLSVCFIDIFIGKTILFIKFAVVITNSLISYFISVLSYGNF